MLPVALQDFTEAVWLNIITASMPDAAETMQLNCLQFDMQDVAEALGFHSSLLASSFSSGPIQMGLYGAYTQLLWDFEQVGGGVGVEGAVLFAYGLVRGIHIGAPRFEQLRWGLGEEEAEPYSDELVQHWTNTHLLWDIAQVR